MPLAVVVAAHQQRHAAAGIEADLGGSSIGPRCGPPALSIALAMPMPRSLPAPRPPARRDGSRPSPTASSAIVHVPREIAAVVGIVERRSGRASPRAGSCCAGAARRGRCPSRRQQVDHALDRIDRLRPAGAAIGRGGLGVGEDARTSSADMRRAIDAGEAADIGRGDRPLPGEIGAQVAERPHPQARKLPSAPAPARRREVVARMGVGEEALGAVAVQRTGRPSRLRRRTAAGRIRGRGSPSCRSRRRHRGR